jgi:hypothetical protein
MMSWPDSSAMNRFSWSFSNLIVDSPVLLISKKEREVRYFRASLAARE